MRRCWRQQIHFSINIIQCAAPEINDAIDALRAGKAEFLGCILNDMAHLAAWSSGYGYGYGKKYDKYGYGQHSARKTQ